MLSTHIKFGHCPKNLYFPDQIMTIYNSIIIISCLVSLVFGVIQKHSQPHSVCLSIIPRWKQKNKRKNYNFVKTFVLEIIFKIYLNIKIPQNIHDFGFLLLIYMNLHNKYFQKLLHPYCVYSMEVIAFSGLGC